MPQKMATVVLGTAVTSPAGTLTVAYPTGTNQAFFTGDFALGQAVAILNGNDEYTEVADKIDVSYGSSDITVTNKSGRTWAVGEEVLLGFAYAEGISSILDQLTATEDEINRVADRSAANRAITATAAGDGTGLMTVEDNFVTVTSANAGHQIRLPASAPAGLVIRGWVGANGCEMQCAGSGCTINNVACESANELALPATGFFWAESFGGDDWIVRYASEAGALSTTLVPDTA